MAFRLTVTGEFFDVPGSRTRAMEIMSAHGATNVIGSKGKEPVEGKFRSCQRAHVCGAKIQTHRDLKGLHAATSVTEV